MKTVNQMVKDILRREGGYVNDPADAGGATNHGVSLRYARARGIDNDNDGDVDAADIRLVTPVQAAFLYKHDFFSKPGIDRLPAELHPQLFDISVNSGPGGAAIILQRALNDLGADLKEDGAIGPRTERAAREAVSRHGWEEVNNAVVDARLAYLRDIVERRPNQSKFLGGWRVRAEEFRV